MGRVPSGVRKKGRMWRRTSVGVVSLMEQDVGRRRRGGTFGDCLQERCKDEGEVVTRIKPMPESTRRESRQTRSETRFLPFGRHTKIHIISQPVVSIHIPVLEIRTRVLRRLDAPGIDILQAIPLDAPRLGVDASVAEAGEDAGAFGEVPDAVVFHAGDEAEHFEDPDAAQEAVGHVLVAEDEVRVVTA